MRTVRGHCAGLQGTDHILFFFFLGWYMSAEEILSRTHFEPAGEPGRRLRIV